MTISLLYQMATSLYIECPPHSYTKWSHHCILNDHLSLILNDHHIIVIPNVLFTSIRCFITVLCTILKGITRIYHTVPHLFYYKFFVDFDLTHLNNIIFQPITSCICLRKSITASFAQCLFQCSICRFLWSFIYPFYSSSFNLL